MATLREEAKAYEPAKTLNIADLDSVDIDELMLEDGEGTDENGKKFYYKYFDKDGKSYRVPNSVLEETQKAIKIKPELKKIKVTKSGSGLSTRYNVDVLE